MSHPAGRDCLCSAHGLCQWVSLSLAVHPSTALNGPGRLNGALRNGSQFPGQQGGAVPRLCVRACCWEGFTSFPLLLSPGEVGYLFLHPQSLCFMGEDMDDSVTFALAVAQAVLCSSCRDLGGSGLLVCSGEQHCIYRCARTQGSHAAVSVGAVHIQHFLGQEWSTVQPLCCAGMLYCSFIPFLQNTFWVGPGEERSVPLLHVTTLQDGNQGSSWGWGAAAPQGTALFSCRWPSREKCWWESLSFTLLTNISCMWLCPFHHKGPVTFSILCSMWLLWISQVISAPTSCLSYCLAHQAFISAQAHARVTKAVSRVLRYLYFWRTFHLGAQEVRVQISLLQPWLQSGPSWVGILQKSWVAWNSQIA